MTITKFPEIAFDILDLLSSSHAMSIDEIGQQLDHADHKELRYAIRRLQEHDVLQIEPNLMDMRSSTYRISSPEELKEAQNSLDTALYSRVLHTITGQALHGTTSLASTHV